MVTSERKHERKVWSNADRLRAGEAILDSGDPRQAMRELLRQYKLQPYQVYAWIGQVAVSRAADSRGVVELRAPRVTEHPRPKATARIRDLEPAGDDELASALRMLTNALSKRAT